MPQVIATFHPELTVRGITDTETEKQLFGKENHGLFCSGCGQTNNWTRIAVRHQYSKADQKEVAVFDKRAVDNTDATLKTQKNPT